jgi:hypothetical protein
LFIHGSVVCKYTVVVFWLSRPTSIAISPKGWCLRASSERGLTTARSSGRLIVKSCRDTC